LIGRRLEDIQRLAEAFRCMMHGEPVPAEVDIGDLEALEGVKKFPVRVKCALLPWTTLGDALSAYRAGGRAGRRSSTQEPTLGDRPNLTPTLPSTDLTHLIQPRTGQGGAR
jgi:hypothetical protein